MNSRFFINLARSNIKKNARLFTPYILMNIGIIALFYIMHTVSNNPGLESMSGGASLKMILGFGVAVIGIFSTIFIFYTNSFLMKRRMKEMGLYNILGMEKKHLATMLFIETFMISVISIFIGVMIGAVFSKLMYLILLKLLGFTGSFEFVMPFKSIVLACGLFGSVFFATSAYNTWHIHLSKPIELIKGGNVGEREPKTKRFMTFVGIVSLSAGYYIAMTVEAPLLALQMFFIAVVLVMVGTYTLFTSGSIALLKYLKTRKTFYYKPNHFISVSGMIYRMKQNAIGLANICILSTAVLVTLSTTVSLYIGMEDSLENQYPLDVVLYSHGNLADPSSEIRSFVMEKSEHHNVIMTKQFDYAHVSAMASRDGAVLTPSEGRGFSKNNVLIQLVPVADYSRNTGDQIALDEDEIIVFGAAGNLGFEEITLGGELFHVVREIDAFGDLKQTESPLFNTMIVFMNDIDTIKTMYETFSNESFVGLDYQFMFDIDRTNANFEWDLHQSITDEPLITYMRSKELARADFFGMYGGFLFLGAFLGTLFLLATVMIIYYKQLSEGYDDQQRFEIMQKVGLSQREIKRSIKSQIVMVFYLPLVTSMLHIAFAFKVITKLLALFSFTNITLFVVCTVATLFIFATIYFIVYTMTARAYYRIVNV